MKVIGRPRLLDFMKRDPASKGALQAWLREVEAASWSSLREIKERYAHASVVSDESIIFNIKGNNCRLRVQVNFEADVVLIVDVGTHGQHSLWQ